MSPKRKRKLWPWLAGGGVVGAFVLLGWLYAAQNDKPQKRRRRTQNRESAGPAEHRGQVLATGNVRPQVGAEVKVGTRISGRVEKVLVDIGDRVEKGQILAELEKHELQSAVDKAAAALTAARAKLALLRKGARNEEIAAAEAAVDQAQAVLHTARLELKRKQTLAAKKLISQEALDNAKRDVQVAEAKSAAAQSTVALKRKLYLPEEISLARAHVAEARAALETAKIRLGYATIRAPIRGVVATVSIQSGETVSAGLHAPTLVKVIDLSKLQVEAYVDEVDIGRVKVGKRATFTVDTYPQKEFKGRVQAIYPNAVLRDNVVNYLSIIAFSEPIRNLRPGMTANVTIQTGGASTPNSKAQAVRMNTPKTRSGEKL
jgi:multidrug resistance efflux pump